MVRGARVLIAKKNLKTKIWEFINGFLAIVGVISLSYFTLSTYMWFKKDNTYTLSKRHHVNSEIFKSGIDEIEGFDFQFGEVYRNPFLGDYEIKFCFSAENYSLRESYQRHWGTLYSDFMPEWLKSSTDIYGVTSQCFGPDSDQDQWLATLLDFRKHSNDDRVRGFEIMIYDPITKKFAFYGHQL